MTSSLDVSVFECRGNGVFDNVGLEIWEASYLLCSYLVTETDISRVESVLELGCGCGLPGLFIARLRALLTGGAPLAITFSDNDQGVLDSLTRTINSISAPLGDVELKVRLLDWDDFSKCDKPPVLDTDDENDSLLLGSALVYCGREQAISLANTLSSFIRKGRCKEVIIVQIKDRPGFKELLERLGNLSISYTVESITDRVFDAAQCIRVESELVDDCDAAAQEDIIFRKTISFPFSMYSHLSHAPFCEASSVCPSAGKSNPIKSQKDVSCVLKIKA